MLPDWLVNMTIKGEVKQAIIETGSGRMKPMQKGDVVSLRYVKGNHPVVRRIEFAKAEISWINRIWFWPDKIERRKNGVLKQAKELNRFAKATGFNNWKSLMRYMLDKHDLPKEFYLIGWRKIEYTFQGE